MITLESIHQRFQAAFPGSENWRCGDAYGIGFCDLWLGFKKAVELGPGWKIISDTSELDAKRVFPQTVLVSYWIDFQFENAFVTQAEYWGGGEWRGPGGGVLGNVALTHWSHKPSPPAESEMLKVCLTGVLP